MSGAVRQLASFLPSFLPSVRMGLRKKEKVKCLHSVNNGNCVWIWWQLNGYKNIRIWVKWRGNSNRISVRWFIHLVWLSANEFLQSANTALIVKKTEDYTFRLKPVGFLYCLITKMTKVCFPTVFHVWVLKFHNQKIHV
jgi:hypothetical protein